MAKQADSQCNSNTSRQKASTPKTTKPACGDELPKTDPDREMEERRATLVADADATSAFEFISDMEKTFIRMDGVVAIIQLIASDDGLETIVQDALSLLSNILGESLEEAKEMRDQAWHQLWAYRYEPQKVMHGITLNVASGRAV